MNPTLGLADWARNARDSTPVASMTDPWTRNPRLISIRALRRRILARRWRPTTGLAVAKFRYRPQYRVERPLWRAAAIVDPAHGPLCFIAAVAPGGPRCASPAVRTARRHAGVFMQFHPARQLLHPSPAARHHGHGIRRRAIAGSLYRNVRNHARMRAHLRMERCEYPPGASAARRILVPAARFAAVLRPFPNHSRRSLDRRRL